MRKYGFDEARPVPERACARETAARVALGAVARSYLKETARIEIVSHVAELASVKAPYATGGRTPAQTADSTLAALELHFA
jgi:chorismate synthase